jgi:hypothetical protein
LRRATIPGRGETKGNQNSKSSQQANLLWFFANVGDKSARLTGLIRANSGLTRCNNSILFDHLVGAQQHGFRNRKAEALRRYSIDGQLELDRLFHR